MTSTEAFMYGAAFGLGWQIGSGLAVLLIRGALNLYTRITK